MVSDRLSDSRSEMLFGHYLSIQKVLSKIMSTPHQNARKAPVFGLSDGEVFLYHLTRDLTKDPTIFLSPNHLCAVATLGSVASYP